MHTLYRASYRASRHTQGHIGTQGHVCMHLGIYIHVFVHIHIEHTGVHRNWNERRGIVFNKDSARGVMLQSNLSRICRGKSVANEL